MSAFGGLRGTLAGRVRSFFASEQSHGEGPRGGLSLAHMAAMTQKCQLAPSCAAGGSDGWPSAGG